FLSNTDLDVVSGSTLTIGSSINVAVTRTLTKKSAGTVDAAAATITLAPSATLTASAGTIVARAVVGGGSLNVSAGATARIATNRGTSGTSRLSNLSITAGGRFDLNDNDLVVTYGTNANPYATIRSYVNTGYSAV